MISLNPVFVGSRNLRRASRKLKEAIADEIKIHTDKGVSEQEASKIVFAQLQILDL